ncbi:hypothetical protein [Nodosilinea nodulosa]|uniref:hypothetical protein n=1 Tax=Nodosilinea nodulosa TaxID=416001 RepID=UPI0012D78A78|nr:hypothetical protein [Nodosilinea nodulosa]
MRNKASALRRAGGAQEQPKGCKKWRPSLEKEACLLKSEGEISHPKTDTNHRAHSKQMEKPFGAAIYSTSKQAKT